MKTTCILALLLMLAGARQPVQPQTPPGPATPQAQDKKPLYRIAGTIVDAVTGDPVGRATVTAAVSETRRAIETTQSADDGHFQLTGLVAGKYSLSASKVGYRNTAFDQHQNFSSAIVTGENQSTENLRFPITPAASLRVQVVDDFGEPVEKATITLAHRLHGSGIGAMLVPQTFAPTSLSGVSTIYMIDPGDYFVAVSAHPWYAMHDMVQSSDSSELRSANPALDVAYPVTFFDNATSEADATPIHLAPGAHEQVTIALHALPALHISIPALKPEGAEKEFSPLVQANLQAKLFGTDAKLAYTPEAVYDREGNLTLNGVAPGAYELQEGSPPRRVELNLSDSAEVAANDGAGAGALTVTVHAPDNGTLPPELKLQLIWRDRLHPQLPHIADIVGGKCSFQSLPPGDWELEVLGRAGLVPILSISVDNRVNFANHLRMGEKPIEVEVVARASALRVEGFALNQDRGQPGLLVLLVPKDLRNHSDWLRHDQSDSDGSFSFPSVLPGNYTLIALENAWDLEWQSPEFLAQFLPGGVPVTIPDQPTGIYRLPGAAKIEPASR